MSIDKNNNLITKGGVIVPPLEITPSLFIDRSLVMYGPSKTGKTVLIKHIMKLVYGYIEQIIIVSPSEPTNRSYEGFVDSPFIHTRLYMPNPDDPQKDEGSKGGLRFLEAIWKRQEILAAVYTRANNIDVLAGLFSKLPKRIKGEGIKRIELLNEKRKQIISKIKNDSERCDENIKNINEKFKKILILNYKKFIMPFYEKLWEMDDITEDERYSLQYLKLNPRMLLIFDDCAAQFKPFFNKEIFRSLFYQNRHCFITVIISCQDDTDLPANLRKNAFISFFTEPIVCTSNFERSSNQFSKKIKSYVSSIAGDIFKGNRKLAYMREDDTKQQFYHIEAPYPELFKFGSSAFHEYSKLVQNEGTTMDKDNPFYAKFKI